MKTLKIKLTDITEHKKRLIFDYIDEYNNLCNSFVDMWWDNKNDLAVKESNKRNYIRDNHIPNELKSKYHSHFLMQSVTDVVKLIKNKTIINKPKFNGNIININQFLGNMYYYESKLTNYWFKITIKHDNINKRIKIPLSSKFNLTEYQKTYQLQKINNDLYLVLFVKNRNNKKSDNNNNGVLGIDLGYKDLIATSNGKIYGKDLFNHVDSYSEFINKKQQKRNKIYQIAEKNRYKNPGKYLNIKRFNLGKCKFNNKKIIFQTILKTFINLWLNKFFEESKILILVMEYLIFKTKKIKKHTKNINRKLSYWVNGYIKKQIKNKADENGVFISNVNPRQTSIQCSKCDYIDKLNRQFKQFKCLSCGYENDADLNAAINILNRFRTDEPRLQIFLKNLHKYWFKNQSESEILNKLNFMYKNV